LSLAGLARSRGSRVTVRRLTKTKKPQGDTAVSWATIASSVPVLLQQIEADRAERLFGRETTIRGLAVFEVGQDVQADDGLIVTAGPHTGLHWKVLRPRDVENRHKEYGVEQTAEKFA
jgi:hypothetical protein